MATEEKTTQPFGNLINPYTNKPVQTGKGVSFNQKIYDAPNYMQQKNDLLDSFNSGMTRQKSVNEQALYDIPVVPEFMNEEYNQAYQAANWLNSLNIATPDEIDEWRAKGKMGIGETAQRLKSLKSAKYVPFVGTTAEVGYNLDMLSTMNRLKKGEKVSQVEQDLLVDYLRELKEIQVRGTTLPSKTLNAILESIPFFIEFGVGVAAAPETFGGSLSVSALALSKAAGKKAARKAVSKALSKAATESVMTGSKKGLTLSAAKQLYKSTYDDMLKAGAGKAAKEVGSKEAAKIVAKTTPESIIAANFGSKPLTYMTAKNTIGGFADRQLAGGMQVTDAGELVFLEPENMALSIMKSFGSSIFDNYTETMGWAFAPVTSYFAKPVRNVLPKKFFTEFDKLVSSRYGMPAAQALKKYGYDGVVEEMGEELLNRFLCDVFGIEGLEGYTIDGFMNNVFYANDPEQWLVEAMSFAAMGGAAHGTHGAYTKIREELEKQGNQKAVERLTELANKRIYSPAEFYLEQGLIKIDGSQSAAEQELRKKFEERGVDKNTANQFFSNASELEIREQLRQYYEEDSQDADKRREKAVDFLANRMLENNSYKNKDLAEKNANLFVTALEKFSETNGIAIEDLIRDEAPTIRNQSEIEGAIREAAPEASTQYAEKYIEDIYNEISALPDDYQDTEYIETQLKNADLAERIKYNTLTDEDYAAANEFINELEAADYIDLANELRAASGYEFEDNNQYMQRTEFTDDAAQIRRKEGYNQLFQSADVAGSERGEAADAAKEWQEKGTDSKYFKKWFGNSKVIDENGKPLIVYHNTNNDFEVFSREFEGQANGRPVYGGGFNFTAYKDYASSFGSKQMACYLSIKNPLNDETYNPAKFIEPVYKVFYGDNYKNYMKGSDNWTGYIEGKLDTLYGLRELMQGLQYDKGLDVIEFYKSLGYDGIQDGHIWIAFKPEQIKSVDNRGTFDAENPNIYYQSAYHGTPHNFDEFSTDYIGNGEGAQAHGWGLYFAGNKNVSEGYRQKLLLNGSFGTKYDIKINGKPADAGIRSYIINNFSTRAINNIMENPASFNEEIKDYVEAIKLDIERSDKWLQTWRDAIDFIEKNPKISITEFNKNIKKEDAYRFKYIIQDAKNKAKEEGRKTTVKDIQAATKEFLQPHQERIDKERERLKKLSEIKNLEIKQSEGQLFEVDIPDDDVLLDENKKYSEQSEKVQKGIKKLFEEGGEEYQNAWKDIIKYDYTGKGIYETIREKEGVKYYSDNSAFKYNSEFYKMASEKLNEYGIKGITYDGRMDGRCYVIFDDKAVKVLEKYYQFAGEGSETADKHSLLNARKMLANGEDAEYVRKTTGWFKGVDGKFRYEISDRDATVNTESIKKARQDEIDWVKLNIDDYNTRMSDLVQRHDAKEIDDKDFREQYDSLMNRKLEEVDNLKYYETKGYAARLHDILDHEKLYAAYPSLRNVRVEFRPHAGSIMGTYSDARNEISLDLTLLYSKGNDLKETLMHEIQHFIQHKENFAVGGNVKNIEIILADAKDAIENSAASKDYDNVMKEYSIVNNLLLIRAIQDNPEKITKSYWWMQQGKGWYAPRKTRKKERAKYINECCQEFIDYSIQKHKDNKTFEGYKNYSKKDTAELKKVARRLDYKAGKILDKLSPSYRHLGKIESALQQLKSFEVNTFDLYRRLSGETEARNTSNRMNLSDEERMEKSPFETSDVAATEQLVVFDDGTMAYSESDMSDDVIQGNMLFDNARARELRKVKGSYVPAENLIELFKNADESTVVHEFAHWWLDRLIKYSANNEELAADVEAIRKFVKNDGEEFTREQHEKFARGFEAYIRSGYAKNNRLKRIFEDFKNALLAIYDSIKQLGYKDDDMPQIQNLFDRLLTSEKERIRATVFDKIAEIDAKIENIKENEAKEFADLDSIYKDNIAYLDRQSQKKRSVQEYLEMAETIPFRETKETREFKKRYKDATFEILEVATGYKRQFIANPRNWEKVQAAFEATDRITATDGMHPNWIEFYPDTGVSYDNDEVDGDNKLAQMAFDVMTEGSYNKTYADNFEFEEIDKFYTKFDYLNNKVKTLKGTEKRAAYEAMISLFNDLPAMPDEIMVEIFNKMNSVEDEYEHQQREDFNRKIIPSIPVMHQLQFYITRKLDALKIYNPETRYKMKLNRSHRLYRYIKDIKSVNTAKKQIRRINEFVIDDMRNNQRMLLHKEIQKQIRVNSKVVKVGTLTKGKFDWKTNTVFAELVEMNKMKREDAEKELGNIVQIQDAEKGENRDSYDENETAEFNKPNDFQDNLRKKFLQYRSMRLQDLDVTHTIQLLQDILELKEKGRQAKSEEDFINKTQRWNTRNNLLDVLEVTKQSGAAFGAKWVAGVGKGVSLNGGTLANWESLLNALFNKDTAQKYSLLQDEAKSEIYARKHMLDFYKKAADIYGFNQGNAWDRFLDYDYMQPLIKLMQEYGDEKYTYTQQVFSINSPDGYARSQIEISRAQMITMFAWSLNEQLEQRLFTQFGLQQIREMFEERLSEQDKQLAWALVDTCENMREDINDVFIRTTGLSLPAVSNYFPSKAERVQSDIDMYHDNFVKSSNPSFIKQRKTCNRIPMKPLAPLEILIPHINKTAKYVIMSEHVNFLNQIFKDTAIKTKMQEIWGSKDGADIYQTLINKLAACTFTNYSKGTNLVAGALDTLSRNYITSAIGFSPKVAIGQLLSVINYAENMPSSEWVKGFAETLKHPVENFKYMLENCEYLQTRLAGNSQNEVISILTSEKDKFRTLRNFMTSNVKWGDIIAITLGGKAYVDWLMKQGMTKEAAFDKFVEDTLRAQQAGTTSSISEWQSAQARNCLTRMFFAFRNTDMQYERKFVDTLIQMKRGDIPKKEAIKKLLIYKIFNPFMFTSFLQNLSVVALIRGAFAGDDPDDVIGGFLKSAVEAVMLGGMTAYGFAGFIASSFMQSLVALYDKEYKHFETDVPIMGDFDRQIQKYLKGDLTVGDYVDALAMGTELTLGLPASKVVNSAEGIGDIAQGNIGTGLSRLAGWGKYTSTKAWTGKEPEKKKKKKRKK